MSACTNREVGQLLELYLLELASPDERDAFEQHVIECEHCATELDRDRDMSRELVHSPMIKKEVEEPAGTQNEEQAAAVIRVDRRWRWPAVIAAAAIIIFLLAKPWNLEFRTDDPAQAQDDLLAIMPIQANLASEQWLGQAATSLLITDLSESRRLTVLPSQQLANLMEFVGVNDTTEIDLAQALDIANKANAHWILFGRIEQSEPYLILEIVLLDVVSQDTLIFKKMNANRPADIFSLIDTLTVTLNTLAVQPQEATRDFDRPIADITTQSPEAYRHYLHGVTRYKQVYYEEARRSFKQALAIDPRMPMAYYYLSSIEDTSYINQALEFLDRCSQKEQYYIRNLAALHRGDTARALAEIEHLIHHFPIEARAYYALAIVHRVRGDREATIAALENVIRVDPYHKLSYNSLAYQYHSIGNLAKAMWACDMYESVAPNEPNPFDTRADLYAKSGMFDSAIVYFEKTVRIKPDFGSAAWKLYELAMAKRDYDLAFFWLDSVRIIYSIPDNRKPMYHEVYAAQGRFDDAIVYIDRWLDTLDQHGGAIADRIYLRMDKAEFLLEKDIDRALAELALVPPLIDSTMGSVELEFQALNVIAVALSGDLRAADTLLERMQQSGDTSAVAGGIRYILGGSIAHIRGNSSEAVELIKRGLDHFRDTRLFGFQFLLGLAYFADGQYASAQTVFEQQLKSTHPSRFNNPIWNGKLHFHLAQTYEALGDYEQALDQYEYFLMIWADAQWELPELQDARTAVERLRVQP